MNTEITPVNTPSIPLPSAGSTETDHRGNGKIARLPKVLRDQVNRMLDDGFSYKAIIEKLEQSTEPPLPYKLLEMNISRWKDNGYQHYLRRQDWRDDLRITRESGSEMDEFSDGPKFQETLVQVALTEIFRVLQQRELKPDSLNYIRLFNALARLNREALGLRKYNDLLAKEQAELKQLDINRDISKNEHRAIADRTDRIFRMPRPSPEEINPEPCRRRREETQTNDQPAISDSRNTDLSSSIENPKSKIQNPSTPLPSRPCRADVSPSPWGEGRGEGDRGTRQPEAQCEKRHAQTPGEMAPSIENQKGTTSLVSKIENCLDCRSPLPPVPPHSLRRPDDHCPSCGMRLPDIGLCYQPGFDHCLNCGATQPALLPGGERPRPHCHKCGERLHNPELPPA